MKSKVLMIVAAIVLGCNVANAQSQKIDTTTVSYEGYKFRVVDLQHVAQTRLAYNWYIGAQLGIAQSWGTHTSNMNFMDRLNPTVGFTVGKEITPISEIRAQLLYARNSGHWLQENYQTEGGGTNTIDKSYRWSSAGLYLSYMPNITNLIWGHGERRFWNLKAVIGLGMEGSWGHGNMDFGNDQDPATFNKTLANHEGKYSDAEAWRYRHTLFANSLVTMHVGLSAAFRLNDVMKLTVEATEHFADDSFDRNTATQDTHNWDGRLNLMVGVTYHLGSTPERRHFQFIRKDDPQMKRMQQQIQQQKKKADDLKAVQKVVYDTVYNKKNEIITLIAFDENSDVVDRLQQTNVFTAARVLEHYPESHIYITNSSKNDDDMYRRRANAIKKILLERHAVRDDQITFIADEKEAKAMAPSNSTYILFIIND